MSESPVFPNLQREREEDTLRRPPRVRGIRSWFYDYFLGEDPTFGTALVPFCFLSILLFTRDPFKTNFIFDEQEALLANPYVRSVAEVGSKFHWLDAFRRDFWGLPADRSIGSYRPIPDLIWRALWAIGARDQTPFLHHWVNVLLHGVNGALLTMIAFYVTRRRSTAWLTGTIFVTSAVLTEAVSGVVGIADVLGALGALLGLAALALPLMYMPIAVFIATLFGVYSKESALCCVPLIPYAAVLMAHVTHPKRPLRWVRGATAGLATSLAFFLYVEVRRRMFQAPPSPELAAAANASKPLIFRIFATMMRWYAQPPLPHDPLNNPFILASPAYRVAGALRVYARGFGQIIFPRTLSGDYSAPQEPIPVHLVFPESIAGLMLLVLPVALSLGLMASVVFRRSRADTESSLPKRISAIVAVALMWIVVSYFPVSNIPVLLPTVRAERFWYFPALGTSMLLAIAFTRLEVWLRTRHLAVWGTALLILFFGFQAFAARRHANNYKDDLTFWDATRHAVPRSAKAHLNYSVMQGARGNLQARLEANLVALNLAPDWPMANVYLGDTLCRMHRPNEALPYYTHGFELAPNDVNLVALGLQCLWDEHALVPNSEIAETFDTMAEKHPGSWLSYLERDIHDNGEEQKGVDPKYRPRAYNEGPKKE